MSAARQLYNGRLCALRGLAVKMLEWKTTRQTSKEVNLTLLYIARTALRRMSDEERTNLDDCGEGPAWLTKDWCFSPSLNENAPVELPQPSFVGKHRWDRVFDYWVMVKKRSGYTKHRNWKDWQQLSVDTKKQWMDEAIAYYAAHAPARPLPPMAAPEESPERSPPQSSCPSASEP